MKKFWYGGKKHVCDTQDEMDAMIMDFQKKKIDPYVGLVDPTAMAPNELAVLRQKIDDQARQNEEQRATLDLLIEELRATRKSIVGITVDKKKTGPKSKAK